jgi:hypothetical protein
MMSEQIEITTELTEQGKGYDAIVLPLMLLVGSFALSAFFVWFLFIALYLLFVMGFMVTMFSAALSLGF